jgi:hypothetical protein
MTDDSTHQSTHRSRLWTALAAASALALVLAAPASRADGYVDDPAYSQGYGGMGAPGVSTAAPADDEAYGAADDEEAMDGADAEEDMAAGEEA